MQLAMQESGQVGEAQVSPYVQPSWQVSHVIPQVSSHVCGQPSGLDRHPDWAQVSRHVASFARTVPRCRAGAAGAKVSTRRSSSLSLSFMGIPPEQVVRSSGKVPLSGAHAPPYPGRIVHATARRGWVLE
ncbi:MAG TPA: hypothetical protein VFR37_20485 [Longimicrobium sp.]|nr:hypothetical protein [Longimicrobium sp.]